MGDKSQIEWTDATWNPTTGCTKVSEGCRHCYIDRTPLFRIGVPKPRDDGAPIPPRSFDGEGIGATTGVMLHPERLEQPLRWKRPRRVFVNSLSDLFHDDVPDSFIAQVFEIMGSAPQHIFQILTKRPRRMQALLSRWTDDCDTWTDYLGNVHYVRGADTPIDAATEHGTTWPLPNVWLGTSVEDQKAADLRIPLLLDTPAAVRFLSCEPLLGPLALVRCPWCGSTTPPVENTEIRSDEPEWITRNPLACVDCGEVGAFDDWSWFSQEESIHWVIAGGESGPQARPMRREWVLSLRNQCVSAGVPFFFKQWGEWAPGVGRELHVLRKVGKKRAGRELDGRTWDEMPGDVTEAVLL